MGSKSKKVTIGYQYAVGMHLLICKGPIDELKEIIVGDKTAWSGSVTANQILNISKPNLFGGEKKEGGIVGNVSVCFGEQNQIEDEYLVSKLGSDNTSAFRGLFGLVLRRPWLTSMSPYIKPWGVVARRQAAKNWYSARSNINNGSANGIHIIYECLTNSDWGLGQNINLIDDTNFRQAADICYNENLGLSLMFSQQSKIKDFIGIIVSHINAIMYTNRSNGKFFIKLIREPSQSEIDNAFVLNENANCEITKFERPTYGDLVNEVTLTYRPRGEPEDSSVTVQDLSIITSQNNSVVSKQVSFPGIDTEENANIVALRELKQASTPLARVNIKANRSAWNVNPGDIIKLSSERYGFNNLIIRVFQIDYGQLDSGYINIVGTEDIFSLPNATFISNQTNLFVEPINAPEDAENQRLVEANYWDLEKNLDSYAFDNLGDTEAYLQAIIGVPDNPSINYDLYTKTGAASYIFRESSDFTKFVVCAAQVDKTQNPTVISFNNVVLIADDITIGSYAYLNNELVRIDSFTGSTITVSRGVLDTVPDQHAANSILYFAEDNSGSDPTEYAATETVNAKALVRTYESILPEIDATQNQITFTGRQAKPWLPSFIQVDFIFYPVRVAANNGLSITWSHRDRTLLLNSLVSFDQVGSATPETGVTYEIEIYNETNTLIATIDAGNNAFYNYTRTEELADMPVALFNSATDRVLSVSLTPTQRQNLSIRFTLKAKRSTITSHQTFDHTIVRSGYGYNYGNYYGG